MKVIIMRGIPGSGKSTIASQLGHEMYCSADDYFINNDGVYNFNPIEIGEAHKSCMRKFLAGMNVRAKITVDNTNVELWEISPYIAICQAYDVDYEIITVRCDPEIASKRNVHGVPEKTILRMAERLERIKLLPWWNNRTINN